MLKNVGHSRVIPSTMKSASMQNSRPRAQVAIAPAMNRSIQGFRHRKTIITINKSIIVIVAAVLKRRHRSLITFMCALPEDNQRFDQCRRQIEQNADNDSHNYQAYQDDSGVRNQDAERDEHDYRRYQQRRRQILMILNPFHYFTLLNLSYSSLTSMQKIQITISAAKTPRVAGNQSEVKYAARGALSGPSSLPMPLKRKCPRIEMMTTPTSINTANTKFFTPVTIQSQRVETIALSIIICHTTILRRRLQRL